MPSAYEEYTRKLARERTRLEYGTTLSPSLKINKLTKAERTTLELRCRAFIPHTICYILISTTQLQEVNVGFAADITSTFVLPTQAIGKEFDEMYARVIDLDDTTLFRLSEQLARLTKIKFRLQGFMLQNSIVSLASVARRLAVSAFPKDFSRLDRVREAEDVNAIFRNLTTDVTLGNGTFPDKTLSIASMLYTVMRDMIFGKPFPKKFVTDNIWQPSDESPQSVETYASFFHAIAGQDKNLIIDTTSVFEDYETASNRIKEKYKVQMPALETFE